MKMREGRQRLRERERSPAASPWGLRNRAAHSAPASCSCQADPTLSWAGCRLHGPPCPKEASPVRHSSPLGPTGYGTPHRNTKCGWLRLTEFPHVSRFLKVLVPRGEGVLISNISSGLMLRLRGLGLTTLPGFP